MTRDTAPADNQTYDRFRTLVLERSGLHFPEKRRRDLEKGLRRAVSRSDCPDLESYYQILARNDTSGREWEKLICQLTIGETYFFRDNAQFAALRQHVLPEIIAGKRSLTRQLRIWSAGCATGEEPYSIAMLLHELLPDLSEWNITILATDINRESLARARSGLYGKWSFREQNWTWMRDRYFTREDKQWELRRDMRNMVWFAYLNLVEDPYPALANNTVAFDLILCRNVTIYFTPEITRRVVERFYEALVEDGWLVVGHSEPSLLTYAQFEPRNFPGAVLYRKTRSPAQVDLSWLETLEAPRSFSTTDRVLPVEAVPAASPDADVEPRRAYPWGERPGGDDETVASSGADLYAEATALLERVERDLSRVLAPPGREDRERTTPVMPPDLPEEDSPSPDELCTEAESFLQQGHLKEALERLRRALAHSGECAQACYLAGKLWADSGQWEEARSWCERALEQDPLLVQAHFLLGLIHGQEENPDQALASMKRVVYLDRNAVLGHYWLANLYRELGDPSRSWKCLENTAELLEPLPAEEIIPWSDGMTAGRLRYLVRQQMNGYQRNKKEEQK